MTRPDEGGRGVAVLLAYYAPPAVGIASQRLAELVRYLPDFGWDPVVVAPASVHYHRSASLDFPPQVEVVRVPNPEPSRWLRRMGMPGAGGDPRRTGRDGAGGAPAIEELRAVEPGTVGRWVRWLVHEFLYVPDAQLLWIPAAARAASETLGRWGDRPTVLFSTSVPFSAHFAARRAAGQRGVPWVAEYRDPWSVAPPQFGTHTWLRTQVDRRLDHEVVSGADHVVVTSDETRHLFLGAFPDLRPEGISVVRNGWGARPAAPLPQPPAPDGPLRLVYTGTLLQAGWGRPLLEALLAWERKAPGAVTLDIYGPERPWSEIAPPELMGTALRLHGLIPGDDVPGKVAGASAVVILQPDAVRYVPGKIYEYIGSRRPILAGVPAGSEVSGLAEAFGDVVVVDPMTVPAMDQAIAGLVARHRRGDLAVPTVPQERVEPLSRRAQAGLMARVFDQVGRG